MPSVINRHKSSTKTSYFFLSFSHNFLWENTLNETSPSYPVFFLIGSIAIVFAALHIIWNGAF
jgi:hypothetical protein